MGPKGHEKGEKRGGNPPRHSNGRYRVPVQCTGRITRFRPVLVRVPAFHNRLFRNTFVPTTALTYVPEHVHACQQPSRKPREPPAGQQVFFGAQRYLGIEKGNPGQTAHPARPRPAVLTMLRSSYGIRCSCPAPPAPARRRAAAAYRIRRPRKKKSFCRF